jgi:hypothetical protein
MYGAVFAMTGEKRTPANILSSERCYSCNRLHFDNKGHRDTSWRQEQVKFAQTYR